VSPRACDDARDHCAIVVHTGPDGKERPAFVSNVEMTWDDPSVACYVSRLASFSRLILFDNRGSRSMVTIR